MKLGIFPTNDDLIKRDYRIKIHSVRIVIVYPVVIYRVADVF